MAFSEAEVRRIVRGNALNAAAAAAKAIGVTDLAELMEATLALEEFLHEAQTADGATVAKIVAEAQGKEKYHQAVQQLRSQIAPATQNAQPAQVITHPSAQEVTPQEQEIATALNATFVCEACGTDMWDNREAKATGRFSARYPDYTCKSKCGAKGSAKWLDAKPQERRPGKPSTAAANVSARV